MIQLVRAAFAARWRPTLVIFLLATLATAAAVSAPLYRWVAAASATTAEVTAASVPERVLSADRLREPDVPDVFPPVRLPPELLPALPVQPGFDTVAGLEAQARFTGRDDGPVGVLAYRSRVCAEVTVVAGRCVTGGGEAMVTAEAAALLDVAVGGRLAVEPGRSSGDAVVPDGGPVFVTVVGLYAPRDRAALYWAARPLFAAAGGTEAGALTARVDAVFTTRETVALLPARRWTESVDLVSRPEPFTDLPDLRATVQAATGQLTAEQFAVRTALPQLADRIAVNRAQLSRGLLVAGLPLVLLSWFVLYFAVAHTVDLRRTEAGLMALRGVPPGVRWALSVAEPALAVLAGAPVGYLLGYLTVGLVSRATLLGAPPVVATATASRYAVLAVGGALLIGLGAQWRAATAPVSTLLRQAAVRRRGLALGATEAVVAVLAAFTAYQLTTTGGAGGGLAPLVPVLLALAVGLLGGRVAGVLAVAIGRRSLRRGRLARGLAAVDFARRPGPARLLTLAVVVFGLVGFAVTAVEVTDAARLDRARAELGAPRVLGVQPVSHRRLLTAVRTADPDGRYAMAAAVVINGTFEGLAVDSARLARIAYWDPRFGPPTAATAAGLLRPRPATPLLLRGTEVSVELTTRAVPPGSAMRLVLIPDEGPEVRVSAGVRTAGRNVHRFPAPRCRSGCRLAVMEITMPVVDRYDVDVTVHAVTTPAGPVPLGEPDRWRMPEGTGDAPPGLTAEGGGLRLAYAEVSRPDLRLLPLQTPVPLPVLAATAPPLSLTPDASALPTPLTLAGGLTVGPGGRRALIDIEYADLAVPDRLPARDPQVWLAADAPAATLDALRAAGLTVLTDTTVADRRALLRWQGPPLALSYYLIAAFAAVGLGIGGFAVAGADRGARARQVRRLRVQGLRPAVAWRGELAGQLVVVAAGAVLGWLAAALAWRLAQPVIPVFVDPWPLPPPPWPGPGVLPGPILALAVFVVAGVLSTVALRRSVERGDT